MKPRTKLEHEIFKLSKTVPPITEKHIQQAKEKCFNHEAWQAGRDFGCFCTECGHEFDDFHETNTTCPNCGHSLTMRYTRKRKETQSKMFSILTTHHGWQLVRYLEIKKNIHRDRNSVTYEYCEVVRAWIDSQGKIRFQAVNHSINPYSTAFIYHSELTLKPSDKADYYHMMSDATYSPQRITPTVRRNGFSKITNRESPSFVIVHLLRNKKYETLWKAGYQDFLFHTNDLNALTLNWPSLKICIRNNYKPKDAGLWYDMMTDIRNLGIDQRNPHYVCPKNLKGMHDEMVRRISIIEKKRKEEERRVNLRKYAFQLQAKAAYFGISFGNGNIQASVLSSIQEYEQEGDAMHNCVFANKYFAKKGSLILSAKDMEGKRLATVEISLKTFKVIQCRAECNKQSDREEEIKKLIESHAHEFMVRKINNTIQNIKQ